MSQIAGNATNVLYNIKGGILYILERGYGDKDLKEKWERGENSFAYLETSPHYYYTESPYWASDY